MNRCRSCRAPITWAKTTNGRPMPLDAEPTAEGNVRIVDGIAHVLGPLDVEVLTDEERADLRMPHHATCEDAAQWKGPR